MTQKNEEKIQQLQLYEQSLHNLLLQKQQFQTQISEIDSALGELGDSANAYKIIGNIMVHAKREDIQSDLQNRKAKADLRINALEKQENSIKEKVKTLQKEVMQGME
jgi:prefoldin beta subunit